MSKKHYTKELKLRVVHEALLPENERATDIIAAKYHIKPGTVERWKRLYLDYGEAAFSKSVSRDQDNK